MPGNNEDSFDQYSEEVVGRANVADTPERVAFYKNLSNKGTAALWTIANKIEPWEPVSESVPMLWKFDDLRESVLKSLDLVTPEEAGRRVIYFENKGRKDVAAAVGWLYSGLQVMAPGERAFSHRHSASALRFIMEGSGAFTNVDGRKMTLGANDFVITPNGTWHEHGVSEDGSICIWQDGLDIPLMNALDANFYEVHPDLQHAITHPLNEPSHKWSAVGLRPYGEQWNKPYSPLLKYEWAPTYDALVKLSKVSDGSPYDAIIMEYIDPNTGRPPMQTMGACMQLIRPGEHTKAHRHTGSIVYQCAKGAGFSIINGQRFDWKARDVFVVPSWAFHEHANISKSEDACLFSFNDLPAMHSLGLYREEAFGENDGFQPILNPL